MRRITKALVLILMVGLLWPGCECPTETEPLDRVGDEVRLTDNDLVEYDPVFYDTSSYEYDVDNCMIAYHDGESIHLYDYASETEEVIYTAPAGYTITALTSVKQDRNRFGLVVALEGSGEVVILQEDNLVFTEIYREGGDNIETVSCFIDYLEEYHILYESNGEIYYNNYNDDKTYEKIADGISPVFNHMELSCLYIYNYLYIYNLHYDSGHESILYNDGFNYYELTMITGSVEDDYIYTTSDRGGELDIWMLSYDYEDILQITDMTGDETDINAWDEYVVFVRTVDGQSDIYIVKGGYR